MQRRLRQRVKITCVLGVAAMLSACMFLPDFYGQHRSGKYDPVPAQTARPQPVAVNPVAESQTEPHTCGLHAMRSLYRAYGLDPSEHRLRFRLGTDEPAMRSDKDSTGTLHPDLYRVLAQDGFRAEPIDLDDAQVEAQLRQHLADEQLALVVVYRDTYHWVLIGPSAADGELTVYDSLEDGFARVAVRGALADALSVTLVRPADAGERLSTAAAHTQGVAEMARLYRRKE
jgi:hypothetical protein